MISFTLTAQLPSGKNQIQRRTHHYYDRTVVQAYPNKRFKLWREHAANEVLTQVKAKDKPLTGPLVMNVQYVPQDKRTRDIPGMTDALFHLFEFCGLIEDDGQIQALSWARALAGYTTIQLRPL